MTRDNLSTIFAGRTTPPSVPATTNAPDHGVVTMNAAYTNQSRTQPDAISARNVPSDNTCAPSTSGATLVSTSQREQPPIPPRTKPGTESIQYLKYLGSMALKPLRELQLVDKLQSISAENMEEIQQNETGRADQLSSTQREVDEKERASMQLAIELQDREEEEECQRIKLEADRACQLVGSRYDALVKFTTSCPRGNYEEFIEFLLMGGGRSEHDNFGDDPNTEYYNNLLFENFYDEKSDYRKLWNDNLTLGLPQDASTLEGRAFVPARGRSLSHSAMEGIESTTFGIGGSSNVQQHRQRTFSEDERLRNIGLTIQNQIGQLDKQRIKQGLGSAVGLISNVSSFALKPLRDLQLAEKLNAINIDMEEAEARKEIEQYNRKQDEIRDLEEMRRIKREAEESCLNTTTEHLLEFIKANPTATYKQWIEDLHPENAHDGTLLEGLGKTIDHRFFVEESDHRRIWNENLYTFLNPKCSKGRDFVPPRARMMSDNGEMVIAADILSGSFGTDNGREKSVTQQQQNEVTSDHTSVDLIEFD